MDNEGMPKLRMEPARLIDRGAIPGPLERCGRTLRRWIPKSARRSAAAPKTRVTRPARAARAPSGPPGAWDAALGWQISACMLVCLLVIGMKLIDAPVTRAVLEGLDYAVNTPTDIGELGKLKFVDALTGKTAAVFGGSDEAPQFAWPMKGEITSDFDADDRERQGIAIRAMGTVTAAMDGQVFYVGENSRWGSYIRMRHAGGWDTIYGHVTADVKTGRDALAGETLGWCGGELLFEIWREGVPTDPVPLLPPAEAGGP